MRRFLNRRITAKYFPQSLVAAVLAMLAAVSCGAVSPASANGPAPAGTPAPPADSAGPMTHGDWDRLLKAYVDERGNVAYRDLAASAADRAALEAYLGRIAAADPRKMSRDAALAYHINAYNACIMKGVLDGRSAESLLGRARFFKIYECSVAGEDITLDHLEQRIIRPRYEEARIHFALVCASASCPQLEREAWTADNLETLLDRAGRKFLADEFRNPLGNGPEIRVSKIFDWYREDFEKDAGSLQAFLARYAPVDAPGCLARGSCRVDFIDYDWTLNAQDGQRPGDAGGR